jgi:hypothetical protein
VTYSRLYLWVEGPDDERFVERVVVPLLETEADFIKIVPYARQTKKWIANFFKSIKAMGAAYIFFVDNDRSPCVTARKQKMAEKYPRVDEDWIQVVVEEIESWYLAGLDEERSEELGMPRFRATDAVSKEQFDALIPKRFSSRIDFMLEVLNHFNVDAATVKNRSFERFLSHYAGDAK